MNPRLFCLFPVVLLAQTIPVPLLTPAPAALSFVWQAGGTLPAAQALSIKGGTSKAAFTTAIAPVGIPWMTITPDTGTLPATMSVLVNPSGLALGLHVATIQVSVAGFPMLSIPVSLTVEAPPPTLVLSGTTLSFSTPVNPPAAQTLTLTTTGGPVPFNASGGSATWMTVTPSSGVVLPGFPLSLTVAVNNTGLDPNSTAYSGKITIVAMGVPTANKTQTVAVSMLVNALTPTVTGLWPAGAMVGSGGADRHDHRNGVL